MNCFACGTTLRLVFGWPIAKEDAPVLLNGEPLEGHESRDAELYQFDNALWVEFSGGYAMFVESPMFLPDGKPLRVVICHDCAHEACEKLPWMEKLIDPHGSHAHNAEYMAANPTHQGWDYDYDRRSDASPPG